MDTSSLSPFPYAFCEGGKGGDPVVLWEKMWSEDLLGFFEKKCGTILLKGERTNLKIKNEESKNSGSENRKRLSE